MLTLKIIHLFGFDIYKNSKTSLLKVDIVLNREVMFALLWKVNMNIFNDQPPLTFTHELIPFCYILFHFLLNSVLWPILPLLTGCHFKFKVKDKKVAIERLLDSLNLPERKGKRRGRNGSHTVGSQQRKRWLCLKITSNVSYLLHKVKAF